MIIITVVLFIITFSIDTENKETKEKVEKIDEKKEK
jgi:hypothetical protein